jgi:hypothetical protein
MLLVLMLLGATDYATRIVTPARWQMPRQIEPVQVAAPPAR